MYCVTPILEIFSLGRDRQVNYMHRPHRMDDAQK